MLGELFTITPSPGQGEGCFALQDLFPGQRVHEEEPLIVVEHDDIERQLWDKVKSMSPNDKLTLLSLHTQKSHHTDGNGLTKDDENTAQAINLLSDVYFTNAMLLASNNPEVEMPVNRGGIFPTAAKLNHSCLPNCIWTWNENIARITVHAACFIPKGEQLTICYNEPAQSRRDRSEQLKQSYGFDCGCVDCCPGVATDMTCELDRLERNDMLRVRVELAKDMALNLEPNQCMARSGDSIIGILIEMITALREIQLHCSELPQAFERLGDILTQYGDRVHIPMALDCYKKASEIWEAYVGTDNPRYMETSARLTNCGKKLLEECTDLRTGWLVTLEDKDTFQAYQNVMAEELMTVMVAAKDC